MYSTLGRIIGNLEEMSFTKDFSKISLLVFPESYSLNII